MKLFDVVKILNLDVKACSDRLDTEVTGGYASDLLSDVIARAEAGNLWITLQTHQNIVAVGVMKSLCGIILVNGREPEEATIQKAEAQGIPVLSSALPAYELAGTLFELGIGKDGPT